MLCFGSEGIQCQEESFRLGVFTGHQRVIEASLFVPCPNPGQILRGKAKNRAGQRTDQRDILTRIHHRLQQAAKGTDFLSLEQIRAAAGGTADTQGLQRPLEVSARAAGRPQKNHDIPRLYRAQSVTVPYQCIGSQHITDSISNKGCFLRIGVRHGRQRVQLYAGIRKRNMGNAFPESLCLGIIESSDFRCHTGRKHMIDTLDNLSAGAEIVTEQHLSSLPRLRVFGGSVGFIFFKEYPRVCQPELIDGLLDITHQKAILLFEAQRGKNRVLHTVGILIFVHQNLPVSASNLRCGGCGIRPGFAQQKIQGVVLQIAEVQNPAAALGCPVIPVKLLYQSDKSPGAGG